MNTLLEDYKTDFLRIERDLERSLWENRLEIEATEQKAYREFLQDKAYQYEFEGYKLLVKLRNGVLSSSDIDKSGKEKMDKDFTRAIIRHQNSLDFRFFNILNQKEFK